MAVKRPDISTIPPTDWDRHHPRQPVTDDFDDYIGLLEMGGVRALHKAVQRTFTNGDDYREYQDRVPNKFVSFRPKR